LRTEKGSMKILVLGGSGLQGKSVSPVSSGYEIPEAKTTTTIPTIFLVITSS